jgi:hypothetical protein
MLAVVPFERAKGDAFGLIGLVGQAALELELSLQS